MESKVFKLRILLCFNDTMTTDDWYIPLNHCLWFLKSVVYNKEKGINKDISII